MAFNQPQSGWTAMSLAPNPDKFAAASVNIDRVSQPQMQLQRSVMPALTPPVISPVPMTPAYQQLQSQIFGGPAMDQLAQAQLQASQATAAPVNAFVAVEKSLKADPWVKSTTSTLPQSKFLDPTGTKTQASGWVPQI